MSNNTIEHQVFIQDIDREEQDTLSIEVIKQAVLATLWSEAVDVQCVVSVMVTDDEGFRGYNKKYRGIDKATDVLSFPMQVFDHSGWSGIVSLEIDEDTGKLPLGDIIISSESVRRQAEEYGNTVEYETAYLIIHSALHLLAYDHDNDSNEQAMHNRTKQILKEAVNDK